MRLFVTGATGFVGSALAPELQRNGHQVVGLARNDEAANKLTAWGAETHRGSLLDEESLTAGARCCDGVIHLAHDTAGGTISLADSMSLDRRVIAVLTQAFAGTAKVFVWTTGTLVLTPGKLGSEQDPGDPTAAAGFRVLSENDVLAAAEKDIRACVVRLAPSVHRQGDRKGFVSLFVAAARRNGVCYYIDEGKNRWPAVHRHDAARLYRLAVESGDAGACYHGAAEGVAFADIARAIGDGLGLPTTSISPDEARSRLDWWGPFAAIDNPVSSRKTREHLGWVPSGPTLIEDIHAGFYF